MGFKSIAISGPPESGKSTLIEVLKPQLNLDVMPIGNMLRDKWKAAHPNGKLRFESFFRKMPLEELRELNREIGRKLESENLIVDTRYVSYMNNNSCLLVQLTAPFDLRVMRARSSPRYKGKSLAQIRKILRQREEDEVSKGKKMFGVDYRDPTQYHLVLNSSFLRIDEEAKAITSMFLGK